MRASIRALTCAALFAAVASQIAVAKTTVWKVNTSGNWSNAANWSNGVPVDGDVVDFSNPSSTDDISTVDFQVAPASLSVTNYRGKILLATTLSTGTLQIGNASAVVDTGTSRLTVTGTTTISAGLLLARSGAGGLAADLQGNVTVSGGAYNSLSGDLRVGANLAITSGLFNNAGGGTLVFSGAGAQSWSGSSNFGPVRIQGAGTIVTLGTDVITTSLQVDGDATLRLGGRNLSSSNLTLSAGGAAANGGTLDVDTASSTISLTGSYSIAGTAKPGRLLNVGNLVMTNLNGTGTLDDAAGIDIGNITVGAAGAISLTNTTPIIRNLTVTSGGNLNLDTNNGNLRLTGTIITISSAGGLTATNSTSLVTFEGGTQSLTLNGATLPAVQIGNATATTVIANDAFAAIGTTTFAGIATTTLDLEATNNSFSGTVTIPANNVLSASGAGAQAITLGGNLNLSGAAAIALGTTDTLIFAGVGARSLTLGAGSSSISGRVQVGTGSTATALTIVPAAGSLSIAGLAVSGGNASLNLGGFNGPIVTGTTTVASGGILTNTANGTPTFQGAVTINSGGMLVNSAAGNITFNDNLFLAGAYTHGAGTLTLAPTGTTRTMQIDIATSLGAIVKSGLQQTTLTGVAATKLFGSLNIQSNVLAIGSQTVSVSGVTQIASAGTLSLATAATFNSLAGGSFVTSGAVVNSDASSVLSLAAGGTFSAGSTYASGGTLRFSGTGTLVDDSSVNLGAVIVAPGAGNTVTLAGAAPTTTFASLAITNGTFDMGNESLTVGASGLIVSGTLTATGGALTVAGSTSINGGSLNATGNTVDLNGNVSGNGGSLNANHLRSAGAASMNFSGLGSFNVPLLTLLGSGSNTLTPHSSGFGSLTINKTNTSDVVSLASGTYSVTGPLNATKGVVDVLGSVSFASPFNVQGTGATLRVLSSGVVVTFNGGTVASGGGLNFSNATGMSIRFNAGSTLQLNGAMTVLGGGAGARVNLTSTSSGSQWNLDKTGGGTVNVTGAFVRDSRNLTPPNILAATSDDGGNNVNWSFALPMTVTVRGGGTGNVTSAPGGINCPGTCSATFSIGAIVQLAANPTGGSVFTGWLGACTGIGPCSATNAGATLVSATFAPPGTQTTLDADLSAPVTIYDAATDGVLILRDMFGYTGAALTTGAVNLAGQRTGPTAIASYLSDIRPQLDVDGNGRVEPLTDGLLLLRYLLGLTGASLTNGAIGIGATRASPDIETHIQSLKP